MRGSVPGLVSPHPLGRALPAVYQEDQFAQALLAALDEVLAPVFSTLDNFDAYLDPHLAPDDFVNWLGTWVGITIDETWDADRRREVVARAVELYRLRGTAAGLGQQVEIHTGGTVEIIENGGSAWSIDAGGELPGNPTPLVVVRVHVDDPKAIDPSRLDDLVAAAKPAHVEHRVEIVKRGARSPVT
jgi:phage tail-like protein